MRRILVLNKLDANASDVVPRCRKNQPVISVTAAIGCGLRWPRVRSDRCLTNNAAECALLGPALPRTTWLFAGSDCGAEDGHHIHPYHDRALNDVDPKARLADVFRHTAEIPQSRQRTAPMAVGRK